MSKPGQSPNRVPSRATDGSPKLTKGKKSDAGGVGGVDGKSKTSLLKKKK